jgi:hypothetical protein
VVTLVALCAAEATFGQARSTVEIAPFVGYRFGGSVGDTYSAASYGFDAATSAGLTVSVPVGKTTAVAFLFSRQNTGVDVAGFPEPTRYDLTIDHWMLGAAGEFPGHGGSVHPFIEAYLGVTQIQTRNSYSDSSTYFSAAVGGGVTFDLATHVGVRFGARGYAVFVNSSTAAACGGGCAFAFSGSAMFQGEVAASLVFKF